MKTTHDPVMTHRARQTTWAKDAGVAIDRKGYTQTLDSNHFRPLGDETRAEFQAGAGGELGEGGKPGKLAALHSSAALVCNFFDYWRKVGPGLVAKACGAGSGITRLEFERTFSTGLRGIPPHLDVLLSGEGVQPTAIESKFLEPYSSDKSDAKIKSKYANESLWLGLPNCGKLAMAFSKGKEGFRWLDGHQLLKHTLGLTKKFGPRQFRLLYLWYDVGGQSSQQHRQEVDRFHQLIRTDVVFASTTYQNVFEKMKPMYAAHREWSDYMRKRYFAG